MKKLIFILLVLTCCISFSNIVHGQITTRESPVSFKKDVPPLKANLKTIKTLPSLNMVRIQQEDNEDEAEGIPPRFGYRHKVDYDLENSGEWVTLANGDRIWRLDISCPGALSINLLYDKFWVPDSAKLFVYSKNRKNIIGAITSVNNKGDKVNIQGFATGLVYDN